MIYLTLSELLHLAERTLGGGCAVRDGRRLTLTNDQADDLAISVAAGQLDDVDLICSEAVPT